MSAAKVANIRKRVCFLPYISAFKNRVNFKGCCGHFVGGLIRSISLGSHGVFPHAFFLLKVMFYGVSLASAARTLQCDKGQGTVFNMRKQSNKINISSFSCIHEHKDPAQPSGTRALRCIFAHIFLVFLARLC